MIDEAKLNWSNVHDAIVHLLFKYYNKPGVSQEVKDYYDYGDFQQSDIIDVARGTTKEGELFNYAYVPDYHKANNKDIEDDFNR